MTAYYIEITDGPSADYHFAYFDSHDHLADFLFSHENLDVSVEGEFGADDDPYRIIMCSVPRNQRKHFLSTLALIPGLMEYAGREGYDEFCMDFMRGADRYMNRRAGGITPLQ